MKFRLAVLATLSCAAIASPACAQRITAEANVARSEGDWGGELAVGVPVISDGGFALTPGAGVFFHKRDHDGFVADNSQCFDRQTGGQVSDGKCDGSGTRFFAKAEATYSLPLSFTFGVGARLIGNDLRPYGTIAMPLAPFIDVKGNLGDHYLSAGLRARF